MKDPDCVAFLQWALPQLHMRWPGFRRVRGQVCKRIQRRLDQLSCPDLEQYRVYLRAHPREWEVLDGLSRVTVTRFYRDKQVFNLLVEHTLPELARTAQGHHAERLQLWCAGCASGEEPYTLSIAWQLSLAARFPALAIHILGTDADAGLLARADRACYGWSAVKNLPTAWREAAFDRHRDDFCLKPAYRGAVQFLQQDLRIASPSCRFDLICCRNLAFTYFDSLLQQRVAELLHARLRQGGVLLLGVHERLPEATQGFEILSERLALFRRR